MVGVYTVVGMADVLKKIRKNLHPARWKAKGYLRDLDIDENILKNVN